MKGAMGYYCMACNEFVEFENWESHCKKPIHGKRDISDDGR